MLRPRHKAVIDALLPSAGHAALKRGAFDAGFEDFLERFKADAPASMRLGFSAALSAACWISPLLIARLPPLSRLSRDDAERALEAMGRSRLYVLRQLTLLLKAVVSFCYGADAKTRQALGLAS